MQTFQISALGLLCSIQDFKAFHLTPLTEMHSTQESQTSLVFTSYS